MESNTAAAPAANPSGATLLLRRVDDYVALTKPRVVSMVLVTTGAGFYLGSSDAPAPWPLCHVLVGTALAAGGTLALNQYLERDLDARMERTRRRPLPEGRIGAGEALAVGLILLLAGLGYLAVASTLPATLATAAIALVYLGAYTPLKRRSAVCSIVGAIPGALPPVVGWAAARGTVDAHAWVLFCIMFLWQLPHSLAVARLYRDDYGRAGIKLLPVIDPHGASTSLHVAVNCLALVPVGLLPTLMGLAGPAYFVVALVLGLGFLWTAVQLVRLDTTPQARRVLMASLVYLPVLLAAMVFDRHPF